MQHRDGYEMGKNSSEEDSWPVEEAKEVTIGRCP